MGGKICTVIWHVDDLKISHVNPTVVTEVLKNLEKVYGKLSVTRGKIHNYLGMVLDFSDPAKVKIKMTDYVKKVVQEAEPKHKGNAVTPANNNLFVVNKNSPLISKANSQYFHTMTAKLLFLSKRGIPDILKAVAFLTTRVKAPTEEDYEKRGLL